MKYLFVLASLMYSAVYAQSDSLAIACYPRDTIQLSNHLASFYKKWNAGESIKVIQLGDSHVQMGHFPSGIQTSFSREVDTIINTAFWFPYALTWGYNPIGVYVDTIGKWLGEKMVGQTTESHFALTGHALVLIDSVNQKKGLTIQPERPTKQLEVLIETTSDWQFKLKKGKVVVQPISPKLSIVTLSSKRNFINFNLSIKRLKSHPTPLRVLGFRSANDLNEGWKFESYGSSGGKYNDYVNTCDYCAEHLKVVQPDLVILSLGTNDSHKEYTHDEFYSLVEKLVQQIQQNDSTTSILLTTQPDTFYKEQLPVSDTVVHQVLKEIAIKYTCALWNLAEMMGGELSILTWLNEGLASTDLLHFTEKGYAFQAQLLVGAIMKARK